MPARPVFHPCYSRRLADATVQDHGVDTFARRLVHKSRAAPASCMAARLWTMEWAHPADTGSRPQITLVRITRDSRPRRSRRAGDAAHRRQGCGIAFRLTGNAYTFAGRYAFRCARDPSSDAAGPVTP